jgi:hypothetical protein
VRFEKYKMFRTEYIVPISAIGGGHISPASLKRSGRFFAKRAKNLSVKSCYKILALRK